MSRGGVAYKSRLLRQDDQVLVLVPDIEGDVLAQGCTLNGLIDLALDDIAFLQTQQKKTKRKMTSITTGTQVNAGHYKVTLTGEGIGDMLFDALTVE